MRKFRSIAAPKGTKLGSGYQDRTRLRTSIEEDEKAVRVKALEDMVKLGQMDMATFEALRDEIIGGEVKDVHLVKGLDWKLLERIRKGEDVLATNTDSNPNLKSGKDNASGIDVDEEFDLIEEKEIQPVEKQERLKKGEMATIPALTGKKRNRDEILKELKASRLAEKERQAKVPSLGPRFTKLGEKKANSRIEKDNRGRDVLITVDDEGRVKRKVKKTRTGNEPASDLGLLMPDKDIKPLGMEITPAPPSAPVDDHDEDIFEGIGNDYNPLAGFEEDESDESDDSHSDKPASELSDGSNPSQIPQESTIEEKEKSPQQRLSPNEQSTSTKPQNPSSDAPKSKRNYFNTSESQPEDSNPTTSSNSLHDPTILAALKKASTLHPISSDAIPVNDEEAAKAARRKKMLETHDRDEDDMDMGFGGSRLEDGEDGEDGKIKLSVWNGKDGREAPGGGKGKRKRGGKKKKGDVNSAADVLQVMERRKGERK